MADCGMKEICIMFVAVVLGRGFYRVPSRALFYRDMVDYADGLTIVEGGEFSFFLKHSLQ